MYLAKYILCAFVFIASLLFVIRTKAATSLKSWRGVLARVLLSVLLLSFVGIIWYYATEENFGFKWVQTVSRVVSATLFVMVMPDVWADSKNAADTAALPPEPKAEAEAESENAAEAVNEGA